jgi:hypothetical protein
MSAVSKTLAFAATLTLSTKGASFMERSTALARGLTLRIFQPEITLAQQELGNTIEEWENLRTGYEAGIDGLDSIRLFVASVAEVVTRTALTGLLDELETRLEEFNDFMDDYRRKFLEG